MALDDDARATSSTNMDDTGAFILQSTLFLRYIFRFARTAGFFSVQVMQKALQNFGLECAVMLPHFR